MSLHVYIFYKQIILPIVAVLKCSHYAVLGQSRLFLCLRSRPTLVLLPSLSSSSCPWCNMALACFINGSSPVWPSHCPLRFKHKHLKHFSCAATPRCMQLKTFGPTRSCTPVLGGHVRRNGMTTTNDKPTRTADFAKISPPLVQLLVLLFHARSVVRQQISTQRCIHTNRGGASCPNTLPHPV